MTFSSIKTGALALGAAATVGLAGYALYVVVGGGEIEVLDGLLADADPGADADRAEVERRRDRLSAMARGVTQPNNDSLFEDAEEPPPQMQPGDVTPEDARAGFDYVMRHVEKMGRKRRRLSQDQWQETWRTANDAYTALSIELDGNDPGDLAELEEAHRRLKKGLRRVRVRGGKFNGH